MRKLSYFDLCSSYQLLNSSAALEHAHTGAGQRGEKRRRFRDDRAEARGFGRERLIEVRGKECEVGQIDGAIVVVVPFDPLRARLLVEVGGEKREVGEVDFAIKIRIADT